MCIDTFGANIVIIDVNFIVAVTVITKPICQRSVHPGDRLDQTCKLLGARRSLEGGGLDDDARRWDLCPSVLALT